MERSNKKLKDNNTNSILDFIYQNAMGIPRVLSSVPASPQDLKASTWGLYSDTLYIRFPNGKLYSFSGTEIT